MSKDNRENSNVADKEIKVIETQAFGSEDNLDDLFDGFATKNNNIVGKSVSGSQASSTATSTSTTNSTANSTNSTAEQNEATTSADSSHVSGMFALNNEDPYLPQKAFVPYEECIVALMRAYDNVSSDVESARDETVSRIVANYDRVGESFLKEILNLDREYVIKLALRSRGQYPALTVREVCRDFIGLALAQVRSLLVSPVLERYKDGLDLAKFNSVLVEQTFSWALPLAAVMMEDTGVVDSTLRSLIPEEDDLGKFEKDTYDGMLKSSYGLGALQKASSALSGFQGKFIKSNENMKQQPHVMLGRLANELSDMLRNPMQSLLPELKCDIKKPLSTQTRMDLCLVNVLFRGNNNLEIKPDEELGCYDLLKLKDLLEYVQELRGEDVPQKSVAVLRGVIEKRVKGMPAMREGDSVEQWLQAAGLKSAFMHYDVDEFVGKLTNQEYSEHCASRAVLCFDSKKLNQQALYAYKSSSKKSQTGLRNLGIEGFVQCLAGARSTVDRRALNHRAVLSRLIGHLRNAACNNQKLTRQDIAKLVEDPQLFPKICLDFLGDDYRGFIAPVFSAFLNPSKPKASLGNSSSSSDDNGSSNSGSEDDVLETYSGHDLQDQIMRERHLLEVVMHRYESTCRVDNGRLEKIREGKLLEWLAAIPANPEKHLERINYFLQHDVRAAYAYVSGMRQQAFADLDVSKIQLPKNNPYLLVKSLAAYNRGDEFLQRIILEGGIGNVVSQLYHSLENDNKARSKGQCLHSFDEFIGKISEGKQGSELLTACLGKQQNGAACGNQYANPDTSSSERLKKLIKQLRERLSKDPEAPYENGHNNVNKVKLSNHPSLFTKGDSGGNGKPTMSLNSSGGS